MKNEETAKKIYAQGYNCAQSVLSTYAGKYGLDNEISMKISCGMGAGCARQSLTCGAVNAGFMVIGLRYGRIKIEDEESKRVTYEMINRFAEQFKEKFGTLNCYELLGCDLATEGGQKYYEENNLFDKECMNYVAHTCSILDSMGL